MEYRGWVYVRDLDVESDAAERLLDHLGEHHGDLGPVLSGAVGGVEVVLATDRANEADAARELYAAVVAALVAIGLADHYPASLTLEAVPAEQSAAVA